MSGGKGKDMEKTFWYKDAVIYQIWPRSFKDADGDGVGDLMGVYEKLDYLKSLHVDAIWFSPLYPSPNADFGYDVADYMDISAEYGGMAAFKKVLDGAHERGIRVVPIPAASACVTALAASGQPTARFVFEGFLPVPKRDRRERLAFLQNETRTMIFYEAPHKLRGTLDDLAAAFGADRSVSLCRELTKLHEEIKKTTLGEAVAFYKDNDPRGEYVLVLAGTDPAAVEQAAAPTLEEAVAAARALQAGGLPPAAAAKQAAAGTPFSKGEIYKELIK